ncbi:MAG TPA: Rieske 2Fe-2S domain-containing protein [Segeticoccus sp.]|nr:Rieske 2Fe-2S domain-containing protein [Segeticoccus sp.]
MALLPSLAHRLEQLQQLDRVGKPLSSAVTRLVQPRLVRNLLSGTNLGHPLHPMLTDVPIGAWTMAALLDTVGGERSAPAADGLVGAGIAAAVPTAASGLNDWSDLLGEESRVGLVHATANSVALSLYGASLVARLTGHRRGGRVLSSLGMVALGVGGYLGGHLAYSRGVNVNHTAFHSPPSEWTPVLPDAELAEGQSRRVDAAGSPVLLHRSGGRTYALDSVCTHAGGPLEEGTFADGCVTCPWHGSVFELGDGTIRRGPASTPQPVFETRTRDGQIEVRAQG